MASAEASDPMELFAAGTRNKPARTYSHKGRNSRVVSLPALKPSPNPPPANTGARLQRFSIGRGNSSELRPVLPVLAAELPIQSQEAEAEEEEEEEAEVDGDAVNYDDVDEVDPHSHAGSGKTITFSVVNSNEQITSPPSPPRHTQASSNSGESGDPEWGDGNDDDDDELIMLSQRPLGSRLKHDRRTGNGTRSLRRRPFLIFDKTEAKGYKQLKHSPQVKKTAPELRYQPGDGFSGREAKPNGLNLLTRSGKQAIVTNPHVGILDLTQSDPKPPKQKRSVRRAGFEDNSFAPAPKKARRPLAPKDPNLQLKPQDANPPPKPKNSNQRPSTPTPKASVQVKKSSSALAAPDTSKTAPPAQQPAQQPAQHPGAEQTKPDEPPQDPATNNTLPPATIPQQIPPAAEAGDNDEVDMIIAKSDDIDPDNPSTTSKVPGIQAEEGQDSCETHVTDSPPRCQLRVRARSVSPESPERRDTAWKELRALRPRVFRRVWTQ